MAGSADEVVLKEMLARIRHRGPDDSGIYATPRNGSGPKVAIGNNRLSIIDLSAAGHQPMANEDRTIWVAYNGEIYNFQQLRQEIIADGHQLCSHTDTEILPHLYEKYGPDFVKRLNGIFAFALWDAKDERLWIYRDRMGVKPLYYTRVGSKLFFASEIKALLACPEVEARIDLATLPDFLSLLYVPGPNTMFQGIYKLPPGHRLCWKEGEISVEPYWNLRFQSESARPEKELAEELHHLLLDATKRQLISDVPVGFFLSGGLDSSALLACAAQTGMAEMRCYSIAFRKEHAALEQSAEDSHFARQVAGHFGANFQEMLVDPDVASLLPKIIWHLDEPVADHAAIATYLICNAAKPEVTVLLSGQGSDEIFGGYRVHHAHRLSRHLARLPRGVRNAFAGTLSSLQKRGVRIPFAHPGLVLAFCRFSQKMQKASDLADPDRYAFLRSYFDQEGLSRLLSPDVRRAGATEFAPGLLKYFEECKDEDSLNQLLYVDCKTFLPDFNLTYTDKMSMACSIEARVPFLDNEVVDFSLRLPPELKIKGFTQKYLLRRAFNNVLPPGVLKRRKAGFGLPVRSWLRHELRDMVHDLLSESRVRQRGLLNPAEVARMIQNNESGQQDYTLQLWALLTLELWQEAFLDSPSFAVASSAAEVQRT